MSQEVPTVLGPVDIDSLGITLTHEHFFIDLASSWFVQPQNEPQRSQCREEVTMDKLWWIRRSPFGNYDNLRLEDYDEVLREVLMYRDSGGRSIIDPTPKGIGGDLNLVRRLASETGLTILVGTAYYIAKSHPPRVEDMTVRQLADEIENELRNGIGGTNIVPALIGEIGVAGTLKGEDYMIHRNEEKMLRAAAKAHTETGAPIMVHPPRKKDRLHPTSWWGLQILDMLEEEGVNLRKVVICHIDRSIYENLDFQKEIAKRGAYVEYDEWGFEYYNETLNDIYPSDMTRVQRVKDLLEAGYLDRLLFSQDTCMKIQLTKYGGYGYAHILRDIAPILKMEGITEEQLHKIFIDNPKELLKRE